MTILFILITDNFPYKTDRLLKLEIHSEILKTVPNWIKENTEWMNDPITQGAFHSTQKSGNFGWFIKWNGPFRFGPTGIFGTSFEGDPLWPVWSFRSVGPKCRFPFAKIVVPSTALFYPAFLQEQVVYVFTFGGAKRSGSDRECKYFPIGMNAREPLWR